MYWGPDPHLEVTPIYSPPAPLHQAEVVRPLLQLQPGGAAAINTSLSAIGPLQARLQGMSHPINLPPIWLPTLFRVHCIKG